MASAAPTCTSRTARWTRAVRPPQVIGHEMSGTVAEVGERSRGLPPGDEVVVRPLDPRGETPADRGFSHISRNLKFLGIDAPGALQPSWTVPAFTLHALPAAVDLRLGALAEPLAVACHDVRRGEVATGQTGGRHRRRPDRAPHRARRARPRSAGARRRAGCRPSPARGRARRSTLSTPLDDVAARVLEASGRSGAEVVFEVSGSAAGILAATKHACLRGRIVVVAIFPEPKPVALFDLFWKELEIRGARVYEPEDFEAAIELLAGGSLDLERLITAVEPLERVPALFDELRRGPPGDEDPGRLPRVNARFDLSGRTALVTGCRRGIGKAAAVALAAAGADVVGVSASLERGQRGCRGRRGARTQLPPLPVRLRRIAMRCTSSSPPSAATSSGRHPREQRGHHRARRLRPSTRTSCGIACSR